MHKVQLSVTYAENKDTTPQNVSKETRAILTLINEQHRTRTTSNRKQETKPNVGTAEMRVTSQRVARNQNSKSNNSYRQC